MDFWLSVSAVLPILIYMGLGALLNRRGMLSPVTQGQMNKIIFSYLFPLVMFNNIYRTDLGSVLNGPFLLTMVALVLLVVLLTVLLVPRSFSGRPAQGTLMQAIIRGNSILFALPVVATISGPENTGLASLCIAVVVPLYNIICVIILESLRGEKLKPLSLLLSILKNPLVLGALVGLGVKAAGIGLPDVLEKVAANLAGIVTPLALIMLGAGLKLSDTLTYRKELVYVSVVKLLLVPLLFVLPVHFLGFGRVAVTTAMAMGAVPTAVSTYVMAKEMGADHVLAGQVVAVTTVLSVGSLFLWVLVLSGLGWIG